MILNKGLTMPAHITTRADFIFRQKPLLMSSYNKAKDLLYKDNNINVFRILLFTSIAAVSFIDGSRLNSIITIAPSIGTPFLAMLFFVADYCIKFISKKPYSKNVVNSLLQNMASRQRSYTGVTLGERRERAKQLLNDYKTQKFASYGGYENYYNSLKNLNNIPNFQEHYIHALRLTCPLTKQLFVDPVTADDGLTYERKALENWFITYPFRCPSDPHLILSNPGGLSSNKKALSLINKLYDKYKDKNISSARDIEDNYRKNISPHRSKN